MQETAKAGEILQKTIHMTTDVHTVLVQNQITVFMKLFIPSGMLNP